MKIKSVHIENWRSIKELDLNLSSLTELVGKNNSGKSNILTALLFFFGEINKVSDQDYYNNSCDIVVEVTFQYLDERDQLQFKKYVTVDGEMTVRKTAFVEGTTEYRGYSEQPVDECLREENLSGYLARDRAATLPFADTLPPTGRLTLAIVKPLLEAYLQVNKATLPFERQLEASQFMGVKTIAQGMLGEVLHIPPVSSASDELNTRGNTAFNRLYLKLADQVAASSPEYRDAQAALTKLAKSLNRMREDGTLNTERPEGLTKLEDIITESLQSWHTTLHVEFDLANAEDAIKLNTSVTVDDGIKTDVSRKGHGLQRSLIFALIKSWAKILRDERLHLETEETEATPKRAASNSHFFFFEEPELFLHPHAQRELFASLKELASNNNQIFLTTHSSSFLRLEDYQSIVRVCKDDVVDGTTIVQCDEDLFNSFDEKKKFDLNQWLCPNRSEMFFATRVILVEGSTEEVVLPFLAKQLDVYKYDYSIINCGGKKSIPTYVNLLNSFQIKYVVVYDLDQQEDRTQQQLDVARIEAQRIDNMVDPRLGFTVVFQNDIEEELDIVDQRVMGKPYTALQHISEESFVIPDSLALKIRRLYSSSTSNATPVGATIIVDAAPSALTEGLLEAANDSVSMTGEASIVPDPDATAQLAEGHFNTISDIVPPSPETLQ